MDGLITVSDNIIPCTQAQSDASTCLSAREYWNFRDPPSANTTKMCREYGDGGDLGEDNLCSISVKTNTANDAHWKVSHSWLTRKG